MNDKLKEEYPDQWIYERGKFTCQYCGLDCSENFDTWWYANLNIDHVIPQKHGGTDDQSNKVVACRACNLYKGSERVSSLEEAREFVSMKRRQAEVWFRKHVIKKHI